MLNDFSKLESELVVTKQVNFLLSRRLVNTERQCWANAQHSRREYLDIIGILSEDEPDVLEGKVVNIFKKLGHNILSNNIEACNRVSKKSATVTITFSRRKDCQKVLAVKKDLCKFKMEDVGLSGQNKLFTNENLCPYYKVLWSKSKKLHSLGKINSFFITGDIIKIKVSENSLPLSITHVDDLGKYFPDIDLSPPEYSV